MKVYAVTPSGGWYGYIQRANEEYARKFKKAIEDEGCTIVDDIRKADAVFVSVDKGSDDATRRGYALACKESKPAYKTSIEDIRETLRHAKRDRRKKEDTAG